MKIFFYYRCLIKDKITVINVSTKVTKIYCLFVRILYLNYIIIDILT